MVLRLNINLDNVPFTMEQDPDTGQVTARNDDLRVMAIGRDKSEAAARFQVALAALARQEVEAGRPLPEALARHQKVLA